MSFSKQIKEQQKTGRRKIMVNSLTSIRFKGLIKYQINRMESKLHVAARQTSEILTQFWSGKLKARSHLQDLAVEIQVVLIFVLEH
jgi:hypothetical protein